MKTTNYYINTYYECQSGRTVLQARMPDRRGARGAPPAPRQRPVTGADMRAETARLMGKRMQRLRQSQSARRETQTQSQRSRAKNGEEAAARPLRRVARRCHPPGCTSQVIASSKRAQPTIHHIIT